MTFGTTSGEPSFQKLYFPARYQDAFDHLFGLGLSLIVEQMSGSTVRVGWRGRRTLVLETEGIELDDIAQLIHSHAENADVSQWLQSVQTIGKGKRSPISPRLGALGTRSDFVQLEHARQPLIDSIQSSQWLTLRFIGALGRPSDWSLDQKDVPQPDRGASAWEMKTRNRGEEFVQNRLAPMAHVMALRTVQQIAEGLSGQTLYDELGSGMGSRTPTGLRAPGPVDTARAWCALWGIASFEVRPVTGQQDRPGFAPSNVSCTAAAFRHYGRVEFVLPIFDFPVSPARYRALASSSQFAQAALTAVGFETEGVRRSSIQWLQEHGINSVVSFPRHKSDNDKAPELWAGVGKVLPVQDIDLSRSVSVAESGARKKKTKNVTKYAVL